MTTISDQEWKIPGNPEILKVFPFLISDIPDSRLNGDGDH
jgi:hypothetical protein